MKLDQDSYRELKIIASSYMANERNNHTLCPTALVNEAFLKFKGCASGKDDKVSFLVGAARNMRQILVNHAIARNAQKRGGGQRTYMVVDEEIANPVVELDVIKLDEALNALELKDEVKARIVELRYFSGMTNQEVADELQVSVATVKRKWTGARAWLFREMTS